MPEEIIAYPIQWPTGWERSDGQERNYRFHQRTVYQAQKEVRKQIGMHAGLKAEDTMVVSSNYRVRQDGGIIARQSRPEDQSVAVYWREHGDGEWQVMACDAWDLLEDNLWAVAKSLEALRGIDRWGCTQIMNRAFLGMKALPETGTGTPWWSTLGFSTMPKTAEEIRANFTILAKKLHPDVGGDVDAFARLAEAKHQGLMVLG